MMPFIGIGLTALKFGGKLLAKTKLGSKVAGKLAEGAKRLFSGKLKKDRSEVKKEVARTDVSAATKGQSSTDKGTIPAQSGGIMDMVKKYWYVAAGLIVVVVLFVVLGKKKKRR